MAEAVDDPSRVVGYYALSAGSVGAAEWPGDLRRKLPHYPVPVAILGRLAVDSAFQGRKLGAILLADACGRVVLASSTLAVHALVVDALNDRATSFYQHFGFMPFPGRASKLFLPLKTIQQQMAPEVRA